MNRTYTSKAKKYLLIFIAAAVFCLQSCAKYGCPSNGRNIGAEKILAGDKQSLKALKKAGKFKH